VDHVLYVRVPLNILEFPLIQNVFSPACALYIFPSFQVVESYTRYIIFSFSTADSLVTLCFTLVRSTLEHASVAWNMLASSDARKLKSIQQNVLAQFFRPSNPLELSECFRSPKFPFLMQ
jgi:hypothetical protein